ncbi:helix-turn-helix transcriptional regulator [Streptomyces albipurpureus]|uniref:LuxR family transcriptional regulator n=1 Tax=Streptomyces albipurpureus TaxID=2897419 RepID=A0ABT0UU95_9ACTN|nr:LuxR family transcriptional regulator [Streptomyces sp. CWNU-1]MCM2390761.1 LuxR family transcriptional regulator [Streptomyces sp. CWNU-1]
MAQPLLERDEALRTAADHARSARSRQGRWLLLRGETGSGRTALLRELVRRETSGGRMRPVSAHASRDETGYPFAVLRQLFPHRTTLPYDDLAPHREQRLFQRLVDDLAAEAADTPLLITVEALDLADRPSLRWLGYLTRRLQPLPLLIVLTTGGTAPDGWCEDTGTDLPVPPLGEHSAVRLAALRDVHGNAARDCFHASAGGNPLLLHALLADLPPPARTELPTTLAGLTGDRYRTAVARWLNADDDPARRDLAVALAVALSADPDTTPDLRLLRDAAGPGPAGDRPAGHLPPEPRPAGRGGTPPTAYATAHHPPRHPAGPLLRLCALPLGREAVLASADTARAGAVRHRIARNLYRNGAPAIRLSGYLLGLPQTGEEWLGHALEEAAESAWRTELPLAAAELLRHALTGPLTPARHSAATLRLSALEMARCTEAGTRRLREDLARADCHDPYTVASALSGALAARGRTGMAVRVLEEAGERLCDKGAQAALRITAAGLASQDARRWDTAVTEVRDTLGTCPPAVEPAVRVLATIHEALAGRVDVTTALDTIGSRPPARLPLHTTWAAGSAALLEWADRLGEARALAARSLPAHPDLHEPGHHFLLTTRATADFRTGHHRRLIEENTLLVRSAGERGIRLPYLHALLALARYERGEGDRARRPLDALGPPDGHPGWNEVLWARARIHAGQGRWERALADYLECGESMSAQGMVNPVCQAWRPGAAVALARLGRRAEAAALAEENLHHARAWGTPRVVGTALRAQGISLGGRRGLLALRQAADLLATAPAPLELAEALLDLGRAEATAGHARKARAAFGETLRRAGQRPATVRDDPPETEPVSARLAAVARRALGDLGGETGGGVSGPRVAHGRLTEAEHRVVRLVLRGLTNAQIGETLRVTRRTVETHLTSSYKKLGVSRRTQLAARLAEGDPY